MKEKLLDVEVIFVHDQGSTGQIELSGVLGDDRTPARRTIDLNASLETHERLIMTLVIARMTKSKLQSVTISGGSAVCIAI